MKDESFNKVYEIISRINTYVINPIILLLFGIALLFFFYGLIEYLLKSKTDTSIIKKGTNHILFGIFGMFIMVSVFAILRVIVNSLPIDNISKETINRVLPE